MRIAALLLAVLLACSCAALAAEETAFGGVGLQVVPTATGELVVLRVVSGSPAAGQGVLPGDLIVQVDDFSLQGSEFGEVVSKHLWGPVGSTVKLYYLRPGANGQRSVVLKRTAIDPRITVTPSAKTPVEQNK